MYTVYHRDDTKNCKKIDICKDLKIITKWLIFLILFELFNICAQGLFVEPIMALLKEVGIIEYTVINNAYLSKGEKSYHINGTYTDTKGIEHYANIQLIFPPFYYKINLNNWELINEKDSTIEAAYYTFMPSYDMLRHPSLISILVSYSILGLLIYGVRYFIKRKRSKFINIDFMTLIRPIGIFTTTTHDKYSGTRYKITIIWETPNGECYGDDESHKYNTSPQSLDFPHEYCACYIRTKDNNEMIITEKNYFEIEKYPNLKRKLKKLKSEFAKKEKEQMKEQAQAQTQDYTKQQSQDHVQEKNEKI